MASGEVVEDRSGGYAGHREAIQDAGDGDDAPELGAELAGHRERTLPPMPTGLRKVNFANAMALHNDHRRRRASSLPLLPNCQPCFIK